MMKQFVNPNNALHNFDEALDCVLAEAFRIYNHVYTRGMMTEYSSSTLSLDGVTYSTALDGANSEMPLKDD